MGKFIFKPADIDGVCIIEPEVFRDARGCFMELHNLRVFEEHGINQRFVQDNLSISKKGKLRGLHFQKSNPQGKLIKVLQGEIYDAVVDIRTGSKTFGKWIGVTLKDHDNKLLFIAEGFAHGFLVLSETAAVLYKCTDFYNPMEESGLIWNDSAIGIKWPLEDISELIMSDKDKSWPGINSILSNKH